MMRKPAVIVGLILVPLVTTSALVVHLTNSSTTSGDVEHPALMSTPQPRDEAAHGPPTGTNSESAATTQSDAEGNTGTNHSKEPAPRSDSSGGEADQASSEPTSEVMLAETITDHPSSHPLALLPPEASSLDFPRTWTYASRSAALGNAGASAGNAGTGSSSDSGTASPADVKNTSVDSPPAQEQSSDPVVDETSNAIIDETSPAHGSSPQTGESNDSSPPHFPSQSQPEQIVDDAPGLVSETGPTPPHIGDEPEHNAAEPVQVPEPSSLMLLGLGLIGLAVASRKRA